MLEEMCKVVKSHVEQKKNQLRELRRKAYQVAKAIDDKDEKLREERQVDAYFERTSAVGHRVVGLLALALGQPRDFFRSSFSRALELMNLNYYHTQNRNLGCGSHTDYGMITLLMTDGTPGLQVCKASP